MFLKHAKMRRDLFALIISTGIITVSCSPGSSGGGGAAASATGVSGSIAAWDPLPIQLLISREYHLALIHLNLF